MTIARLLFVSISLMTIGRIGSWWCTRPTGRQVVLPPAIVTDTAGTPQCVSWLFATHGDTAFYETHCIGGSRPDSIANPETRR